LSNDNNIWNLVKKRKTLTIESIKPDQATKPVEAQKHKPIIATKVKAKRVKAPKVEAQTVQAQQAP
jgi:hypothetical protein